MRQSLAPTGSEKDDLPPLFYGKNRANGRFKEEFNSVETDRSSGSLDLMGTEKNRRAVSETGCRLKKSQNETGKVCRNRGFWRGNPVIARDAGGCLKMGFCLNMRQ